MPSWELIARGRVQGVGFRWHVRKCALDNSVTGYVQNQSDGSVLIIATAEEHEFERFCHSIQNGHTRAWVSSLELAKIDYAKSYNDFTIR